MVSLPSGLPQESRVCAMHCMAGLCMRHQVPRELISCSVPCKPGSLMHPSPGSQRSPNAENGRLLHCCQIEELTHCRFRVNLYNPVHELLEGGVENFLGIESTQQGCSLLQLQIG